MEHITITCNGEEMKVPAGSIASFLQTNNYPPERIAVARNGTFVPRGDYSTTNIEDGDILDIVAPMQGG